MLPELQREHVSDRSQPSGETVPSDPSGAQELRTIAFRLREIQRLLAARVEQENRRLQSEGIDPVADRRFYPLQEDAAEDATDDR